MAKGNEGKAKPQEEKQVNLGLQEGTATGRFATAVVASLGDDHCVLSFLANEPLDGSGKTVYLSGRIYLTLPHMRRLAEALAENVAQLDEREKKS